MHLLIVDDEPIIRKGLVKMAKSFSPVLTEVQVAANGVEALEMIRSNVPKIVMTDIRMPKMDGIELCKTLAGEYPNIQKVIISGYNDFNYAQKCLRYGVKEYLLKPLVKSDFHNTLTTLIKASMQKAYIPFSTYMKLIDELEISIWLLQKEKLAEVKQEWIEYFLVEEISIFQLNELVEGCISSLIKRFDERRFNPHLFQIEKNPLTKERAVTLFTSQLDEMFNQLMQIRNGDFKDPMEEARNYIDNRLNKDITLDKVASVVGLTPNYFSMLFKKATGVTFIRYRIHRRMDKAKELLSIPHMRIIDIAEEVGYDDYPHFTKTFKKIFGISPSQYREFLGIK